VGDDFRIWKDSLWAKSTGHSIALDSIELADIIDLTDPLEPNKDGVITILPDAFVLVRTREHITLPLSSKLAARVEGRSKQARLGMTAHITADHSCRVHWKNHARNQELRPLQLASCAQSEPALPADF